MVFNICLCVFLLGQNTNTSQSLTSLPASVSANSVSLFESYFTFLQIYSIRKIIYYNGDKIDFHIFEIV